jgi:hypothetical protein
MKTLRYLTGPNLTRMRVFRKIGSPQRILSILAILLATLFSHTKVLGQSDVNGAVGVDLPLVDPTNVPPFATFYSLSTFGIYFENSFGAPLPWNPCPECEVYYLGSNAEFFSFTTNAYVVDDTSVVTANRAQQMMAQDPPPSPGGDSGNGEDPGPAPLDAAYSYPSNYLWLSIEAVSNGVAYITAHGTISNETYEVLSRTRLNDTNWISEGTFIGDQDSTPMTIAVGTRTNQLFLWARSWADDGSGLPLWWQLQYFGRTGIDPYDDADGDGWLNIQEYQNNTNPTLANQPPAPTGLRATLKNGSTTVNVRWNGSQGRVLSYVLERYVPQLNQTDYFTLSTNSPVFNDTSFPVANPDPRYQPATYRIKAHFALVDSPQSSPAPVYQYYEPYAENFNPPFGWIMPGQQSHAYLVMPPARFSGGTGNLIRYYYDFADGLTLITNWVFSLDTLTNGPCQIPDYMIVNNSAGHFWYLEMTNSAGTHVSTVTVQQPSGMGGYWFYDGREQLSENLSFWLRASPNYAPFTFRERQYGFNAYPSDYVYSDFHALYEYFDPYTVSSDCFLPFNVNYLFRNFVFDPAHVDSLGEPTLGWTVMSDGAFWIGDGSTFTFSFISTNALVNIPSMLSTNQLSTAQPEWIYAVDLFVGPGAIGVESTSSNMLTLLSDSVNYFGLPILSAKIAYQGISGGPPTFETLDRAGWVPPPPGDVYAYGKTAEPQLHTIDYYFCQPGLHLLPGHTNFVVTNTSPPLIAVVGQPSQFAGFAKQSILNGDPTKFAYLGQYFERADKIGTNGSAGTISPYGDFLPTEVGQAALVTMTNYGVNERGTAVVNVISLALDANHDGTMDTSMTGPDYCSFRDPYVFWINNNHDRWHDVDCSLGSCDHEQDEIGNAELFSDKVPAYQRVPDSDYINPSGLHSIPCTRDLQDYARLWMAGVTSNLVAALPTNSTLTLSWSDSNGQPSIVLFSAADTDGGIGYLTNSAIASNQVDLAKCPYLGKVTIDHPIQFTKDTWRGNHFIWCGVSEGSGALTLTISDGDGNTLAQAKSYISLVDIKQLYEHWTVGEDIKRTPLRVPIPAPDELTPGNLPTQFGPPNDPNTAYILFVHGWNMQTWEKNVYAECSFKRLYWQGYQGRFGLFSWPTGNKFGEGTSAATDTFNYNNSETNAWRSGQGLLTLLTNLNSYYGENVYLIGHSMGNVVAGEALRLAQTNTVVNTYISMEGAVPSHAYDQLATLRRLNATGLDLDSGTPNCYSNYWTPGAPCYFNSSAGAGAFVNFFNTNDFALSFWRIDQDIKPDILANYRYDGTNFLQGGTLLLFPTDTYEIFAHCDEARCYAIGAEPNLGGVFQTAAQVDLGLAPYNYGPQHKFHSGQFRSDNMSRGVFWDTLLRTSRLKN